VGLRGVLYNYRILAGWMSPKIWEHGSKDWMCRVLMLYGDRVWGKGWELYIISGW
jgi:hypothetical protein